MAFILSVLVEWGMRHGKLCGCLCSWCCTEAEVVGGEWVGGGRILEGCCNVIVPAYDRQANSPNRSEGENR